MRALAIALLVCVSAGVAAQGPTCQGCVEARYWQIEPGYWTSTAPDLTTFPERQLDPPLPGADLGVAFSGGGTRSAAATIGQLRGLVQNGWLERVKYMTAVSGGSWAAVPFTYYPGDALADLLGYCRCRSEPARPGEKAERRVGAASDQVRLGGLGR